MELIATEFKDLWIIKPKVFKDSRGYFFESFNQKSFQEKTGLSLDFVQDNESMSQKDVVRGLHFQKPPYTQGKLVRVIKGAVLDVVVDLRKNEPTYGKTFSIEISEENKIQFYVPEGFAHGFKTLEDETIFAYKCTKYYEPSSEQTIQWDDSLLNIEWNVNKPIISDKDLKGISFNQFNTPF